MAPSATSSTSVPKLLSPSGSSTATDEFDIISCYHDLLSSDAELPFPIAAIFALAELVSKSRAATTSELMENIRSASHRLKASLENPVPATAGLDLFTRFVVTKSWDTGDDFEAHKASLAALAHEFAVHTVPSCREKICELVLPFISDDSVVLTHSYSRVVMQALKFAALHQRKRISVYVTESRPHGLGLRTYNQLISHGIPCTVILDSAVAYTMPKVDLVLTGAEGVVESGGCLNAVGRMAWRSSQRRATNPSSHSQRASSSSACSRSTSTICPPTTPTETCSPFPTSMPSPATLQLHERRSKITQTPKLGSTNRRCKCRAHRNSSTPQ